MWARLREHLDATYAGRERISVLRARGMLGVSGMSFVAVTLITAADLLTPSASSDALLAAIYACLLLVTATGVALVWRGRDEAAVAVNLHSPGLGIEGGRDVVKHTGGAVGHRQKLIAPRAADVDIPVQAAVAAAVVLEGEAAVVGPTRESGPSAFVRPARASA